MNINWQFLRFPFDGERWTNKVLVGAALGFGAMFFFPLALPVSGYGLRIMRRTAKGEPPSLPEWDDWGTLIVDGLKLFLVSFVYMLPVLVLLCCTYVLLFGTAFLPVFMGESPELLFGSLAAIMAANIIIYPIMGIGILLGLALAFFALVATTRMVANDSLESAFQLREVWRLAKEGFPNYALAVIVSFGILFILSTLATALGYTLVLACVLPFVYPIVGFYYQALTNALLGAAYYHSQTAAK